MHATGEQTSGKEDGHERQERARRPRSPVGWPHGLASLRLWRCSVRSRVRARLGRQNGRRLPASGTTKRVNRHVQRGTGGDGDDGSSDDDAVRQSRLSVGPASKAAAATASVALSSRRRRRPKELTSEHPLTHPPTGAESARVRRAALAFSLMMRNAAAAAVHRPPPVY